MRRPFAWLLGGAAVFGFLRRRREPRVNGPDPRADALRRKLAESRTIVEEREEFESGETTVDQADPETRRRAVHDEARETLRRMRER